MHNRPEPIVPLHTTDNVLWNLIVSRNVRAAGSPNGLPVDLLGMWYLFVYAGDQEHKLHLWLLSEEARGRTAGAIPAPPWAVQSNLIQYSIRNRSNFEEADFDIQ